MVSGLGPGGKVLVTETSTSTSTSVLLDNCLCFLTVMQCLNEGLAWNHKDDHLLNGTLEQQKYFRKKTWKNTLNSPGLKTDSLMPAFS